MGRLMKMVLVGMCSVTLLPLVACGAPEDGAARDGTEESADDSSLSAPGALSDTPQDDEQEGLPRAEAPIECPSGAPPAFEQGDPIYATTALNLRQGPSTSTTILRELPAGEKPTVVEDTCPGSWVHVTDTQQKTGYVRPST